MNTLMWDHTLTREHLHVLLHKLHFILIPPCAKTLACGDVGVGAMAEPENILEAVLEATRLAQGDRGSGSSTSPRARFHKFLSQLTLPAQLTTTFTISALALGALSLLFWTNKHNK